MAVVATVTVSSGLNTAALRADEAACRIQSDLAYAQSQAILLRKPMCLVFDTTQGLYYLARTQAPTTPITDALSKKDYRLLFSKACSNPLMNSVPRVGAYQDVDLLTANFDGIGTLTYNALGWPLASGGTSLVSGRIEIGVGSEKLAVVIDPVTGYATVQTMAAPQSGLLSWLLGGSGL